MKMKSVFVLALLASSMSYAVLVDNFDGYIAGQIDGVTGGAWVSTDSIQNPVQTPPIATMVIAADPKNAANQVLSAQPLAGSAGSKSGQCGLYGVLTGSEILADNTTATMSLKFLVTNTAYDTSFGLTTLDAPKEFGETFNTQCALVNGDFKARNGKTTSGSLKKITANTWYYLWVVVDNASNKFDIYLNDTAADATALDRIADDFAFRMHATTGAPVPDGDLDRFFVMMQAGTANANYPNTAILFDDINMRNGEQLTYVPEPATMMLLGLGGLFFARKR